VPTRPAEPKAICRFDDFSVDREQRALMRGDAALPLPSRSFDTLVYLIEHRDRCIPKDELIAEIWQDVVVTDDSLIHAISVLRRALNDGRNDSRYIQTIPRRGYRFIGTIAEPTDTTRPAAAEVALADAPVPGHRNAWQAFLRGGLLAGVTGAVAAVVALILLDGAGPPPAPDAAASIRLFQVAPGGTSIVSGGMLSPDGRYLAFVARDESRGTSSLWVRALQSSELRRIEGTEGASKPFWAPDSRRIAWFANGELFVAGLNAGAPRAIADVFAAAGGTWGSDDTILYAEWASGLFTVPASGDGAVTAVLTLDREARDIAFGWPQLFPDNRHFLYQIVSLDPERSGVYIGSVDGQDHVRLLDTGSPAVLAPPHHVLHVRDDMLIAEELDPVLLELTGRATVVARGLSTTTLAADNLLSASTDLLAFQHGVTHQNLSWFDRAGAPLGSLAMPTELFNQRISPDGSRLLASSEITSNPGRWLARLDREEYRRLETDAIGPLWSPDGTQIAFTSRSGFDLITRDTDGEARQLLLSEDSVKILNDWTPDGAQLIYTRHEPATGLDLWIVDTATGSARTLLATTYSETQARLSPDGRWIAYASDETGVLETYVARFPGFEDRQQISSDGGGQPQWRADGSEVYYLSLDRAFMAVGIRPGSPLAFERPQQLFRPPVSGDPADAREYFAAAADGSRFLIDGASSDNDGQSITIMVNWSAGLSDRAFETARADPVLR
jgi:DNA-binding winged helix-turn-helix (wHTH) protein/Tol biopolymer transport system component